MSAGAVRDDPYRRVAGIYDRLFESANKGLRVAGLRMFRPAKGMRILDVGCGTGMQLELYRRYDCLLYGLDASPAMLELARRRLGAAAQLDLGDAAHLTYAGGTFDLVLSMLTLHEMAPGTRSMVVQEMKRVLKRDGRLLLIDFHPGPFQPLQGWLSRAVILFFELTAGWNHFRNQGQFIRQGGLPGLARGHDCKVEKEYILGGGTFAVQLWSPT